MSSAQRSSMGMIMFATGVIMAIVALPVAWSAAQRWMAVFEIESSMVQLRAGKAEESRRIASKAAARIPSEIAPLILAIDPTQVSDLERLEARIQHADRQADRAAALATVALGRAVQGLPYTVDLGDSADGELIKLIVELRAARGSVTATGAASSPTAVTATGATVRLERVLQDGNGSPPHRAVMHTALTSALQRALDDQVAGCVRRCAGSLAMLFPADPQARIWWVLVGAADPRVDDRNFISMADEVPEIQRSAIVRTVATLWPARRSAIATKWPAVVGGLP